MMTMPPSVSVDSPPTLSESAGTEVRRFRRKISVAPIRLPLSMKFGTYEIENGLLLAPMEDVTDPPFRRICKQLGADVVYTEFISSEGLIRDARRSNQKLTLY